MLEVLKHLVAGTAVQTFLGGGFMLAVCTLPNHSWAFQEAQSPALYSEPAAACSSAGGKPIDNKTCLMPNGTVSKILSGAEAVQARDSAIPVRVGGPQAWALATTAIIFEYNGDRHDLLTGTVATPGGQEKGKQLLAKWWNVNTRDDLITTLTWLQSKGHRAEFEDLGRRVDAMNDEEFRNLLATLLARGIPVHRLEVLRANHRTLGPQGILAWDLVRYIALCRWGNLAGYMSNADAWNGIMPAALRLQQTFNSWQDLESDFLIGRDYWSVEQTQETGDRFRAIYDRFIQDANSPWNTSPWTLDLGTSTALSLVPNQLH